ncbi:Sensory box histidine kinase/response regulator [Citrifermentans bremense]|uniref:histidine kinase n=1 Tax=Citrifermentans bremense TaxID=60035 RepID=A0A6S6LZ38_9BACT|nr:PAS domain-containing sensor histidine kinase [Citrifermentans bremense]BCG46230.1 Sensory box histidine kinase/response regulator [Citrifermentans bremense]
MFNSLQNWQALFDNMSQGMFCQDADGKPVEANASALSLLCLDRAEFMAHTPQTPRWRLLSPAGTELPPEQHPAVIALQKGEPVRGVVSGIYTPHNDATAWVKIDAIPLKQGVACIVLNDITQEKLIKEQEHQAALQYELLANTSMDGYWITDTEGRILSVNDAACRMYGYSRDELTSMFIDDFEAWENRHEITEHTEKIVATCYDRFETAHRRKDGTLIEVEVSTTFIPESGRFLAFLQDITSKKVAERALQQSEKRYLAVINNQLEFVDRYLPGGIITFVNDALCDYVGAGREELLGQSFYPFIHEDDREQLVMAIEALDAEHTFFHTENRVVLKDGSVRWHHWSHHALFDEKGQIYEYQSVGRDITERKEVEDKLQESEARFRNLLESIPNVAVQGYGPDGTVHYWNRANETIYGYRQEEALGHNLVELIIPPELRDEVRRAIKEGAETGVMPPAGEITLMRKDGSPVPVFSSHAVVRIPGLPPELFCIDVDFTERKQVEEALRSSERRYRAIVQTQAEFVVRYRRGGYLTFVNDTFSRYMQKHVDELLGQSLYQYLFLQDREHLIRTVESMDAEHQEQVLEVRAWLPDGRLVWQKWNNSVILDDEGQVVEFQASGMDITRSKHAEECLRKSEEKYRSLFDNMLNGFAYCRMILDSELPMDFVYLEVNESFERLTGLRGVKGKRMSEVLPGVGKSDPDLLAAFRRVALSGKPEQLEYFLSAIGEWLAVSVYSPEPGCFVLVFDVITKRKRTDECLAFLAQAVSEPGEQFFNRLAKYLAQSLDMEFVCIDQLEEGNQYARTLAVYFDGSFEDNIRYTLRDTPCAEVVGNTVCCYRQGVRHLFPTDTLLQEIKAESYVGTVLWGSNGVPIGLIAAISKKSLGNRDLPEEILQMVSPRAAAEMERSLHEDERLRLEQQLLHAQKLESLGILAGGIAHDFNNILTGILGNSSLGLMRINPDSPATENLQNIEKAAVRAADLAKQMLAYSGKGMFVVEPVNVNLLLEEMIHLLEVSVSKKAELKLSLAPSLPSVQADPTQLRQIVMNLVINASEAIGEQGGSISISTGYRYFDQSYLKEAWFDCELVEGEFIFLQVADTGCGMDEGTLLRIFDPFFTTKFTGRGLGMSAVLGIIRGHRGAIKVQSKPGKGTTFTVLLPASDLPVPVKEAEQEQEHWQGSGTILLVDDEETICDIGAMMLGQLGYEVVTALSGASALQIYRSRPEIKLVILDLTMPQMDGEQTFVALKALDPEVKVIMSSGYSEQEVTGKFTGTGLLDFIQKPYSMQALTEVMKRCDR